MRSRPLRKLLFSQAILVTGLPFILLVFFSVFWLMPDHFTNTQAHLVSLSKIIAARTDAQLIQSMTAVNGIAGLVSTMDSSDEIGGIIESHIRTAPSLKAVYVIGPEKKVEAVVLKGRNPDQEKELLGLDLSGTPVLSQVRKEKGPVWSDTFLSVIGAELTVALAVPSGDRFVMGEIDLGNLSHYLKQIATAGDQMILVLDRRGQVIADQEGDFTAQQLNLSSLKLFKANVPGDRATVGSFQLQGKTMTGCLVRDLLPGWSVINAIPRTQALRPVWTMSALMAAILLGSLLIGLIMASFLAGRLAVRFENLAAHTRKVAQGQPVKSVPESNIIEFSNLAVNIQNMARSLQEREAYNRVLFADSPHPLLVLEPQSMDVIDANGSAVRIFGFNHPAQLKGQSIKMLFGSTHRDGDSSFGDHLVLALETGRAEFVWHFSPPGQRSWPAEVILSKFSHGKQTLLQMGVEDISWQKEAEEKRVKLEDRLRQAQKMESIGTLAGGIAHDFNNILFPVLGYTEMALEDMPENSHQRQYLQEILAGCLRAKDLVSQILAFSRRAEKETRPLQIQIILKEILKLTRATLPATITIQQEISPDVSMVKADPTQIHQIIMNLITNAFHAMEGQNGTLSIGLNNVDFFSDGLPGSVLRPGRYVCLWVSDTGRGISSQHLEMIFDPYFTTKRKGEGTGLGLSVVHGIVKSYNGEILVESMPGKGATFRVYLPEAKEPAELEVETEDWEELEAKGRHILLVDDEPEICSLLESLLERIGFQTSYCLDSQEALEKFSGSPDEYDVLITDMTMPGMTGDVLAEQVKKIRPDLPVILCTGFSQKVQQSQANLKVDAVLMKPVLRKDLIRIVGKVLDSAKGGAREKRPEFDHVPDI